MDEDNLSQALMIGVSTFFGIIVISAIIIFYNSSISIVKSTQSNNKYASDTRSDIESTLLMSGSGNYIKGSSVINLVNYYISDVNTIISIQNIKYFDTNENVATLADITIDSQDLSVRESLYTTVVRYVMDNQDFTIDVTDSGSSIQTIVVKGV